MSAVNENAKPLDFRKREPISRRRMQVLGAVHERYARGLTAALSAFLRVPTEVSVEDTSQCSAQQFLQSGMDPGCYCTFSINGAQATGAMETAPALAFPMIERLLGGEVLPSTLDRAITEIEKRVIQSFLQVILHELGKAWQSVIPAFDVRVTGTENQPASVHSAMSRDQFTTVTVHLKVAGVEIVEGDLRIAILTGVLEPAFPSAEEPVAPQRAAGDPLLAQQLTMIPVEIGIETPQFFYPMESILSLQPGDTLLLDHRQEWPLELKVCGKSKLHVHPRGGGKEMVFAVVSGPNSEEAHERRVQ
jgi:flagellar motor switch protein FliM